jgi:molecular chaperone DnaK
MTDDNKTKKEKIIGIDLGTSNSAAAIIVGGKPEVIPSAEGVSLGGKAFPSYVAWTKDGTRLIGEPARRQAVSNPDRTVRSIKRKMGENYTVEIDDKKYTPQEISAMILSKIKQDTEAYINEPIKKAVITVPAYFNDAQRTATKDAGTIAGLDVVRIINEPTAACLAYGLDKSKEKSLKICVLDLGGGTFDVTIMEMGSVKMDDGRHQGVFEVISTSGDTKLGGTDMDRQIVKWVISEFKKKNNIDLSEDSTAMARVLEASEKAKIELSTSYSTQINLPFISQNDDGPLHLDMELTRAKLEELISPTLNRLKAPMQRAIDDAGFSPSEIDKVILVGGPTRMPSVREVFKNFFGKEPERSVDPMECVSIGAAIQGAVMAGEVDELLLLDVTPLTLGIETLGGVRTPLIERNTTVPCERAKVFSTAADNQPAVEINVLQGERPMAADNLSLGRFRLEGIPPAPRGVPQIEVKFEIDENGIVNVTAKDLGTGKEQKITIERQTGGLSEEEIQKMVDEAKKHEEEDKEKKERVETKNNAEQMVYQTEKLMKEHADKLDDDLKTELLRASDDVKEALKADDHNRIKSAYDKLNESLQKFGTKIYGQQGGPGGPGGPGGMGGMGGMNPEDFARAAQEAAKQQGAGGATYDDSPKKKKKRKSVDVDWEEED